MELGISYFRNKDMDKGMEVLQHVLDFQINPRQAWMRAHLYTEIDSLDKFFEYANYEPPFYAAPWYRKTIINPKVIQDPRYKQLMDKMNLPMPQGY
jgi:hypothetical protein